MTIDKRYSQFRDLHRELKRIFEPLRSFSFPAKHWFFNFTETYLSERRDAFQRYLQLLLDMTPVPIELNYFLEVASNLRFATSGSDLKRSASVGALLGSALAICDFQLIKVLGQGSFGKVFLVRPLAAPKQEVYAMKVLNNAHANCDG